MSANTWLLPGRSSSKDPLSFLYESRSARQSSLFPVKQSAMAFTFSILASSGMLAAPLVVPEVITGLSLLMLFVALEDLTGWPQGRGMTTIGIAHITFCTAYVAVVVQSRLTQLDPSLEEAAMDLGARPWQTFLQITVPLLAPALLAGWLLAFTLSIDDLVIASFVSGPGASTLPMVIFSKVRLGLSPEINALATLLILAVLVGVTVAMLIAGRRVMGSERGAPR